MKQVNINHRSNIILKMSGQNLVNGYVLGYRLIDAPFYVVKYMIKFSSFLIFVLFIVETNKNYHFYCQLLITSTFLDQTWNHWHCQNISKKL